MALTMVSWKRKCICGRCMTKVIEVISWWIYNLCTKYPVCVSKFMQTQTWPVFLLQVCDYMQIQYTCRQTKVKFSQVTILTDGTQALCRSHNYRISTQILQSSWLLNHVNCYIVTTFQRHVVSSSWHGTSLCNTWILNTTMIIPNMLHAFQRSIQPPSSVHL